MKKSLHFTKKKNPKTRMSNCSRVKRFSEKKKKRVLRFMLFSLLFKKKYNIMAARFFPSLRIVKNKHEKKNFCPDKKKNIIEIFFQKNYPSPKKYPIRFVV